MRTILLTGLLAGTLDITDSLVFNAFRGITPVMVFRYIASALIGAHAAAGGGSAVVALGVALHYLIAFIWTGVFFAASRNLPLLTKRPVLSGLAYGIIVYLFMNLLVLPMSRVPRLRGAIPIGSRINGILALMLFIGLTISLLVRRLAPRTFVFESHGEAGARSPSDTIA